MATATEQKWWAKYMVDVPAGVSGNWKVEKFTVSEADAAFERVRSMFSGGRGVPAGDYTRLMRGGSVVMSDTPDEISDHRTPMHKAEGRCLVNGLGLGMVLQGMLRKDDVEHVTVVELSADVISLVGPHYQKRFGDRLEIVHSDAFTFKPPKGVRYGVVWHDIWDNICADNLDGMKALHRKYGRRCDWQGSWCRGRCEMQNRRNW